MGEEQPRADCGKGKSVSREEPVARGLGVREGHGGRGGLGPYLRADIESYEPGSDLYFRTTKDSQGGDDHLGLLVAEGEMAVI